MLQPCKGDIVPYQSIKNTQCYSLIMKLYHPYRVHIAIGMIVDNVSSMNSTNGSKLPYPLRGATRITINAHEFFHELFFLCPDFSNIRIIRDKN